MGADDSRPVVRRRRKLLGLTQAELAARTGMSLRTIKTWDAGGLPIYMKGTSRLAAELGISLDELAGAAPLPSRSLELEEIALAVREYATAQAGIANELQGVAERLSHLGGQAADDAQAGTG